MTHPSDDALNRFADGELDAREHARIARHLQDCGRCRQVILEIRALGESAARWGDPPLPEGLRARVLDAAARRSGAIVPVADPEPAVRRRARLVWLGAAAVLAAVALRVTLAPRALESEASTLEFVPANPVPGDTVAVTYNPTPQLDGRAWLRLRARFRRADDPQRVRSMVRQNAGTLVRGGDGLYRGSVAVPPGVAFGVFAVEDSAADVVDSHGREGWYLLTSVDGRRPSLAALVQRAHDASYGDWGRYAAYAEQVAEEFPDSVQGWFLRATVDLDAAGGDARDSVERKSVERLQQFDRTLRDRAVSPAVMAGMYFWALPLQGQNEIMERWRTRLVREAPSNAWSAEVQSSHYQIVAASDPRRALLGFDSLWANSRVRPDRLVVDAFQAAQSIGDTRVAVLWARRWRDLAPTTLPEIARTLAGVPGASDTAIVWLQEAADLLREPNDSLRALYLTKEEQRRRDEAARRAVLSLEGRLELASGHRERGLALLDSVTRGGWDLSGVSEIAEALISAGETERGVELLARLAADPWYNDTTVRDMGSALVGPEEWGRLVRNARERMVEVTEREARPRALPRSVPLRHVDGTERDLRTLTAGRVTVVILLFQCVTCESELLAALRALTADELGAPQVLLVTDAQPSPTDLEAYAALGSNAPVLVDAQGAVSDALDSWKRPDYFVIDSRGTILYSYSNPTDIPRQVLAAARKSRPVV